MDREFIHLYDMLSESSRKVGSSTQLNLANEKAFHYIPSHGGHLQNTCALFAELRQDLIKGASYINIMDLGCGDGLFLTFLTAFLSKYQYTKGIGVEINDLIRPFPFNEQISIINKDFFKLSKDLVSKMDIIYAYNPLKPGDENIRLISYIKNRMKKGAHFIFSSATTDYKRLLDNKMILFKDQTYYFKK